MRVAEQVSAARPRCSAVAAGPMTGKPNAVRFARTARSSCASTSPPAVACVALAPVLTAARCCGSNAASAAWLAGAALKRQPPNRRAPAAAGRVIFEPRRAGAGPAPGRDRPCHPGRALPAGRSSANRAKACATAVGSATRPVPSTRPSGSWPALAARSGSPASPSSPRSATA